MITCKEDLIGTIFNIANDDGDANVRLAGLFYDVCTKYGIRVMGGNGRDYFMKAVGEGLVSLCIADNDGLGAFGRVSVSKDSVFGASSESMSNFRYIDELEMRSHLEGLKPQAKEIEWINGLPPVGAECELSNCGNSWVKAEVLFMGTGLCVVNQGYGDQHYHLNSVKFRKPETPEQKLEREFKNSTEELLRGKVKFNNDLLPSTIARVLFNAGYRKGER
jgi:hypothetical protein